MKKYKNNNKQLFICYLRSRKMSGKKHQIEGKKKRREGKKIELSKKEKNRE